MTTRKSLTTILCLSLSALIANAGFKIPKSVFTIDQLEEAKSEALESEKPLVFLYSDEKSTWGPCNAASLASIKSFKSVGVIVYVNYKTQSAKLPKAASKLNSTPEAGRTVPKLFITSADATTPIKVIPYKSLSSDASKSARAFKKELATANILGDSKPPVEQSAPKKSNALLAEKQDWTNSQGKKITAAIKSATDLTVVFVMKYNKLVTYPMDKLSPESQAKIKGLIE